MATGTSRPIAFPDVRDFAQLFTLTTKDAEGDIWRGEDYNVKTGKRFQTSCRIGPFCGISGKGGYRHLYVKASDAVLEYIKANTIFCGSRDAITFKIVVRDDGEALVCADHNLILGSVWLALIDPSTIPEEEES